MRATTIFYFGGDGDGMSDEMDTCAAAYFRGKGKDVATKDEFVMDISLDMKWMQPSDAKLLLVKLTENGSVEQKDGYVRPAERLSSIDVPMAYRPPADLISAMHSKSQSPKETPVQSGKDPFQAMMDVAASNGIQRRDFIQNCNKIQKKLDIEVAVAALIVLRDAGVDIGPHLDAVYDHVKAA